MAVSLPTAADVRKVREQAAKTAAEQAEVVKTPLLAVLGAGEYAYTGLLEAYGTAKERATAQYAAAEKFRNDLPGEIEGLRGRLSTEELRKLLDSVRIQAGKYYGELARHGEATWGTLRTQPQVKQAIATVEDLTGRLDVQVDTFVDEAHDAAEKALATLTTQTRSVGERVAFRTRKAADEVAETITEVTGEVAETVTEVGADAAKAVDEAGAEAAATTRSTTRRAANRTAPAKKAAPARTAPKAASRKPATRRTGTTPPPAES